MRENIFNISFQIENTEIMLLHETQGLLQKNNFSDKPALLHSHALHEMFIILSGELNFFDGEKTRVLKEHDVCIVPPGYLHTSYRSEDCEAKCISIFFLYKKIKNANAKFDFYNMMNPLSADDAKPIYFHISSVFLNILLDVLSYSENEKLPPINEVKIKNIFSLIFTNLLEGINNEDYPQKNKYPKSFDHYIRMCLLFEEINSKSSFSGTGAINEIAEKLSISPRHLNNLFNEEYGTSIKSYCYRIRMQQAAFLLTMFPKMPIHKISESLNYGSSEIFCIMFKRYFGISAGKYRKQHLPKSK